MAPTTTPSGGPFRLMTVNKAPERAYRLVGRVATDLKNSDEVLLEHVGNAASFGEVERTVRECRPDILMCASMWSPEESDSAFTTGRSVMGDKLLTHAIPQGMQVEKGPDYVVEYLKVELPKLVKGAVESGRVEGKL